MIQLKGELAKGLPEHPDTLKGQLAEIDHFHRVGISCSRRDGGLKAGRTS